MDERQMVERARKAIEVAEAAWTEAHRGLPRNPMTKTAAIPGTGILAAAVMDQIGEDDSDLQVRVERAIVMARHAWELSHVEAPGNPLAVTAQRSVIGIIAATVEIGTHMGNGAEAAVTRALPAVGQALISTGVGFGIALICDLFRYLNRRRQVAAGE